MNRGVGRLVNGQQQCRGGDATGTDGVRVDKGERARCVGLRRRQGEAVAVVRLALAYGVVQGLLIDSIHGDGQRHRVLAPIAVGDRHGVFGCLRGGLDNHGGGGAGVPQIRESLAYGCFQSSGGAFTDHVMCGVYGDCRQFCGVKVEGDHTVTTRRIGEGMLVFPVARETHILVPVEAAARHDGGVASTVLEHGYLMGDGVLAAVSGADHRVCGGISR